MKYQKRYTLQTSGPKMQTANPYAKVRVEEEPPYFKMGNHLRTPSKSMGKAKRLPTSTKQKSVMKECYGIEKSG